MPLIRAPLDPDPRTVKHAYISCGEHLYYVLGAGASDSIDLEDALTLTLSRETREHVRAECTLVRAAPRRL